VKREVVVLTGRVQGVGFREQVLWVATRFPVGGTVRNLADGRRVEIDVEGEDGTVDAFLDAVVAEKPRLARIDKIERNLALPRGIRGFSREATS
jgi:acylphosphatase